MKNFTPIMLEALRDPAVIIGTHTEITRNDGVVIRIVDLDEPSVIDGKVYQPNGNSDRTAFRFQVGLNSDTSDIGGLLNDNLINSNDVLSGLYDFADVFIFLAFVNRPELPIVPMMRGKFGDIDVDLGNYTIHVNGMTYDFTHNLGYKTTPTCRAVLGDAQCKVNLANYRVTGNITAVVDSRTFTLSITVGNAYLFGEIMLTNGPAAGLRSEIRAINGQTISLYSPLIYTPVVGNAVRLTQGCQKTRSICKNTFNNLINFQGEPDLPGQDEILSPTVSSNG